ncbi:GntR family transcriptional regulator [Actinomadura mexicana]|uniref:DNA-binding transcriptional regulator, GntR family n=1 Tax=Actinomadura mexicana TaxID=134959 RepID=A0A238XE60_9ACTN|nr:GntR family transcriptional regulator [Actinomadura mexicana]SNR57296.1 DNA-binding transcriptional regulator, GntR family [Actinomadura mexicana]
MTQVVTQRLREAILNGDLKPGKRIRQEAVAHDLGVSRLPVREALRHLESEGLVVIRPNSGARVAVLDFEEYVEIYKIRERLEALALSESILRMTDEQQQVAARLATEIEPLTDDPIAWLEADRSFHLACYAGLPTPRLLHMIQGFWNTTQHYRRILLTTFTEEDFACYHAEHRLIVNAILTGNTRAGEELIRVHIERPRLRLSTHRELFDR